MALTTKLELRQGQQLVMTPQLQQAIRLLQLSNLELTAYVDSELERNPLLERDDDGPAQEAVGSIDDLPGRDTRDEPDAIRQDDGTEVCDTDYENVYPDASRTEIAADGARSADTGDPGIGLGSWSGVRGAQGFDDGDANLEAYVAEKPSLRDHLNAQLMIALTDPAARLIGQHLIDHVSEAGYIEADLAAMAGRLGTALSRVEAVLGVLQSFYPAGVCARNLKECLALQLKDQNRYDPQIAALIDNLELLASLNLPALRRAVGVDQAELLEMVQEIKRLDPKPGLAFGHEQTQLAVPDVFVRPSSDGGWVVELNNDTLPRVLVNRAYLAIVTRGASSERDRGYLNDCLQSANWLVKSIDQRARTILRVAEEIVRQQDAFFIKGVQFLRPLNLKTVADAVRMHESTVSRVTSNKYMATPRGIFELKYFFTSSIPASGEGEAHSSEAVRHRIRHLVDAESADSILSDDRIVELLQEEGIDIARRTVAKYREAMRIPSSVQRRRMKRLAGERELLAG